MNSFIPIDKEAGISSFGVISALRKILKLRKIGHCGTLDPFATGLLICATGQYTRLLGYLEQLDKTYEAELLLGKQSATGDPEGEIIAEKSPEVDSASWETLRDKVLALSMLPIPQYSAVKIEGKRAYRYAREGHILQMPMREVKILDFELLSITADHRVRYRATVSKGTYIRALSEYIAAELGTVGMTTALRRTAISGFSISRAVTLNALQSGPHQASIMPRELLSHLPSITISDNQRRLFLNGNSSETDLPETPTIAVYIEDDTLLGIGKVDAGKLLPTVVIAGETQ